MAGMAFFRVNLYQEIFRTGLQPESHRGTYVHLTSADTAGARLRCAEVNVLSALYYFR